MNQDFVNSSKDRGRRILFGLRRLLKGKFFRNVMTVASGAAAAQAITVLFSPAIARLYGPEHFGALGVFLSMASILNPMATMGYASALVLPAEDGDARRLMKLSLSIAAVIAAALLAVLAVAREPIAGALQAPLLEPFLLFLPAMVLATGFSQVLSQWCIRKKQFQVKAKVSVIAAFLMNGGKTGAGFFFPFTGTLVMATVIGTALRGILLMRYSDFQWKKTVRSAAKQTRRSLWNTKLAKEYADFPKYFTPRRVIDSTSNNLPLLALTALFGPAEAGFYAMGRRVLQMPAQLVGTAVSDVVYPRMAEAYRRGEHMTKLLFKATLGLLAAGVLPFGAVMFFGPAIFGFVLGEEWFTAGEYARWLSLWAYSRLLLRPTARTLQVLGQQHLQLLFSVLSILLGIGGLAVGGILFDSDILAIALFSVTGAALALLLMAVTLWRCRSHDRGQQKT